MTFGQGLLVVMMAAQGGAPRNRRVLCTAGMSMVGPLGDGTAPPRTPQQGQNRVRALTEALPTILLNEAEGPSETAGAPPVPAAPAPALTHSLSLPRLGSAKSERPASSPRGARPAMGHSLSLTTTRSTSSLRASSDTPKDNSAEEVLPVVRRRPGRFPSHKMTIEKKISRLLESDETGQCEEQPHPASACVSPRDAENVVSLCGQVTEQDTFQPFFSGKTINYTNISKLGDLPHNIGVHCQRGQKPGSPNQDDFFVLQTPEWLLCGVADGHGSEGHFVSHFVQERLPEAVLKRLKPENLADWRSCVRSAFEEVQEQLQEQLPDKALESGTTASMVLLYPDGAGAWRLSGAFIGDSIVVYARRADVDDLFQVVMVTSTHRPDRQDELERIASSRGKVIPGYDGSPSRLRVPSGDVAMSRAFGDIDAHMYGMSSEPEFVDECLLQDSQEHLIIMCSDGVWDVLTPREAVTIVSKFAADDAQRAAERLASKAQSRWQQQECYDGSIDDITVIVIRSGGSSPPRMAGYAQA